MNRKVTFLTRSLARGGTETQLVVLARALQASGHPVSIVSLYSDGDLQQDLIHAGIPVRSLSKKGRWDLVPFFHRLVLALREQTVDVLYSFLPVPNILSVLLKAVFPGMKAVWGIRASGLVTPNLDALGYIVQCLEARLSKGADLVISNSVSGLRFAASRGFPKALLRVVHNGIDLERHRPDRSLGASLRSAWNIPQKETTIGLVARLDPVKDHRLFLEAAVRFLSRHHDVRFVCVGGGSAEYRTELLRLSQRLALEEKIVWAGDRSDMLEVYNALDILTLCSRTEGFPNVVAEGMACGLPCVTTDVGDCAQLVEGTGIILHSRTPDALCAAWEQIIADLARRGPAIGIEARAHIARHYPIEKMVSQTREMINAL